MKMNHFYVMLKKLYQERVLRTILLAFLIMVPMILLQPPVISGIYPEEYWARKASWHNCADVVLAGDSKVIDGLCPSEMGKYLHGYKILNYGFGGASFSKAYLEKVESILNQDSDKKIIVTGISPHSLTKRKVDSENFLGIISMSKSDIFFRFHFAKYLHYLEPLKFRHAIEQIRTSREEIENKGSYYPDGWISGDKIPGSIKKMLKKYDGYYNERVVDPCNIDNISRYVEKWVKQGIHVYGFLPPSCKEMYELELRRSGINEPELIQKFKQAGGIWIDVDQSGYVSFDGTHLQRDSALELSRFVAKKICEKEFHK